MPFVMLGGVINERGEVLKSWATGNAFRVIVVGGGLFEIRFAREFIQLPTVFAEHIWDIDNFTPSSFGSPFDSASIQGISRQQITIMTGGLVLKTRPFTGQQYLDGSAGGRRFSFVAFGEL